MDYKVDYIFGMRAVIEALATGKDIDKILVKKDLSGDLSNELFANILGNCGRKKEPSQTKGLNSLLIRMTFMATVSCKLRMA